MFDRNQTDLILGTANWGWTVDQQTAFQLLESWMEAGLSAVDAATNYPINKVPEDFRLSEKILKEFVDAHGVNTLQITMKLGSTDNMRSPENNLAPSFLEMMTEEYLRLFGANLHGIMIHWDNRNDSSAIHETLDVLTRMYDQHGLKPGLSGIAHPAAYLEAMQEYSLPTDLQLKHNVLQSDLKKYHGFNPKQFRFCAYGINAGGVKLDGKYGENSSYLARGGKPEASRQLLEAIQAELEDWTLAAVRPPIKNMNQLGLIFNSMTPEIQAFLLGVSSIPQLRQTLEFLRDLEVFDYTDVYEKIVRLQRQHAG
ncbi:MAG: aldo/keto reductase [Saprospiraceae bacterium]